MTINTFTLALSPCAHCLQSSDKQNTDFSLNTLCIIFHVLYFLKLSFRLLIKCTQRRMTMITFLLLELGTEESHEKNELLHFC